MTSKKEKDLLLLDENNELYVPFDIVGINHLWVLTDGIPLVTFSSSSIPSRPYIKVKEVLKWYEKEYSIGLDYGYSKKLLNKYTEAISICEKILSKPIEIIDDECIMSRGGLF